MGESERMPIRNRDDAVEVEGRIARIFAAPAGERAAAARALFVEALDFAPASGSVDLGATAGSMALPAYAERVAYSGGVHVVYIALDTPETDRVRKSEASAAARRVAEQLDGDLLLVFTNTSASQLHLVYPSFERAQPVLRRLVVERDLSRRTAIQQVSNIYWNLRESGSVRLALDQTFDVEPVTREFFAGYKRVFQAAENNVSGFGEDVEIKRRFVQTLFNRLMFVYFLSRKGWLTFKGDKDYLNALWSDHRATEGESKNFYVNRLRPLFFAGLNNPQSRDLMRNNPVMYALIGGPPFLNGGLFEETGLDKRSGVVVPDDVIESILGDLFDRFNFTVMESTPFDVEVAVDPEMLGKVFEELVTGRHDSGAYYTPRPVVSFMCREALKGYLEGQDTSVTPEAIARFVDERDTSGISVASARKVAQTLDEVTVVDPACGSGAYLLGMMQELVELQTTLFNVGVTPKGLYDLKMHVIQRNLYGVDIDDFAVNIAMLRMWLSLAIDYEGDVPPPLPNLDFKVLCGDSLLGPDPSPSNYGDLFRHRAESVAAQLVGLKAQYMEATTGKDALRQDIERVEDELREALADSPAPAGATDWRVEFAEVFSQRRGFDIAVANPPYVVISDERLRATYKEGIYGRMNTYGLFIQRSLQVMRDGSQLTFINPRTLLTDRYFTNLRKVIKQRSHLKGVVLIGDRHNTFERVLQECIILHLTKKTEPATSYQVNTRAISIPIDLNDPEDTVAVASDRVLLDERYDGAFYIGASDFEYRVFERMNSFGVKLSNLGLRAETGKIQFDKYQEYAQPTNADDACRLIWAENVQRFTQRATRTRVGKEWLSKIITTAVNPNVTGMGIVTQRTTANEQPRRIIATLVTPDIVHSGSVYFENGTNFISLSGVGSQFAFLLAVFNSSLMEFVFRHLNSNVHVSAGEINSLPFPPIPDDDVRNEIESLVFELMKLGGVDCQPESVAQSLTYEHRLDIMVGSLYGFSPGEVESIQQRLPSYEAVYGMADKAPQPSVETKLDGVGGVAVRGQAIYNRKIRPIVQDTERGNFAVIDIYSEDYEIDVNHAAATRRLMARRPGVITYTVRIGYSTTYRMGIRSPALTS